MQLRALHPWLLAAAGTACLVAGTGVCAATPAWQMPAQADRAALAARLAQASGSTLHDGAGWLKSAGPLRHAFAGGSLHDAWLHLLGNDYSHALQCSAQRCQVWVVGHIAGTGPTTAKARPPAPATTALQADPPGLFPSE